jgi:hypothetical protein
MYASGLPPPPESQSPAEHIPSTPCPECRGTGSRWVPLGSGSGLVLRPCPACSSVEPVPSVSTQLPHRRAEPSPSHSIPTYVPAAWIGALCLGFVGLVIWRGMGDGRSGGYPPDLTELNAQGEKIRAAKERLKQPESASTPAERYEVELKQRAEQASVDIQKLQQELPRCPARFRVSSLATRALGDITIRGWVASPEDRRKLSDFVAGLGLRTPIGFDLVVDDWGN